MLLTGAPTVPHPSVPNAHRRVIRAGDTNHLLEILRQIRARDPLTISEFPGGTPKSSILKRLSWDIPIYGNPHI